MKKHALKALVAFLCVYLLIGTTEVKAQLYVYNSNLTGTPAYVNPNLWSSNVKRKNGAHGAGALCPIGFTSKQFSTSSTYSTAGPNIKFRLVPQPSVVMNIQSITASMRISEQGPIFVRPAYSIDNGLTWIDAGADFTPTISFCGGEFYTDTWDIPDFSTSTAVSFKFFGYSATSSIGVLQINDITVEGTLDLVDVDGDGYGVYIDCDDTDPSVHPGAVDICNDIDEDCDGNFDEVDAPISPSGEIYLCRHEFVTLSVEDAFETYLWYKNGEPIPTETEASITTEKPGYYQVYITSGECDGFTGIQAVAVTDNPFANIYYPEGLDLCVDDSLKLKASYGIGYSWQWYKDGAAIDGANFYKMLALEPGDYYCTVSTAFGCERNTDTVTVTSGCKTAAENMTEGGLNIYPNPAQNNITISLNSSEISGAEANVQIFSITGQELFTNTYRMTNGTLQQEINLQNMLPNGVYTVKVNAGNTEFTSRLVINK